MMTRSNLSSLVLALFLSVFIADPLFAQSSVEQNSNVVGLTPAGYYRGIPAMQDNEPSCAINPILPRNIVCAWNGSGGSDDLIGDTWLRFSESIDGGRTFFNRYLNGSNLDQATSIGQQFGADPVMMCWPGGCGTVMLASTRAENGGSGGGIYMQMMMDMNTESGFRKAFKIDLNQVYRSTGSKFADKPHAIYVLDEDNPGVIPVTMQVEKPGGGTESITREWPKARIIVVFALFNPSKTDIEILSTHTDDYGSTWSNPKQVAVTSGRDQGVSLAAIGDTVFYGFRRFSEGTESDAMMGVVVNRDGTRIGKPFEIVPSLCAYDVPTLPNATNKSAAAARTNDFPWVSQNGSNFIMVYSERRSDLGPGCLANLNQPTDSRIMAVVGTSDGRRWSDPVEISPNAYHGFQFMPTVECSLGVCQIAWWDSRRDSQRTRNFLQGGTAAQQAALTAFENLPIFADFQFPTGNGNEVIQFKRTVDMFTKKFEIVDDELVITLDEPVQASRYRLGLFNGELIEREVNPAHVKAYKSNTVPFAGDYNSLTSVRHRFVFNPDDPSQAAFWQDNASPNPLDPAADPLFWLSWTDGRNMRGQLYTSAIDGRPPYTRTPGDTIVEARNDSEEESLLVEEAADTRLAESVEDSNTGAMTCEVFSLPPGTDPGQYEFEAVNNRVKDADIYGALIENRVNAWSLNPTKTLGNILRTYTIVAENEDDVPRTFRFEIVNQPVGYPATARASWDQLPFRLNDPAFNDPNSSVWIEPDYVESESVGPNSSVSVALFLVSADPINPVGIRIFDDATGALVNTITVNGSVESGPLLNPDGTFNDFELHDPIVYAPDQFNPDQFNPDQYNPDQFNPDLYNPDQFNPDQFNPDQFNPDQYNPDQFNPDQFNPDQFNPDQFNPDQFNPDQYNPDQFNSTLTDSDTLHNAEIPKPNPVYSVDINGVKTLVTDVVRLDVNFGIENDGNTLTPYSVDFALADDQVLAMLANDEISAQLIAWQDKQVSDVQFCEPALISENRIIAVANDPDLTRLYIPNIRDNRVGALTYFIAPDDILQNTLRFVGPRDKIQVLADALDEDIISYVFASQAANTDGIALSVGVEQVIRDRTRPRFNFSDDATSVFEATGPGGAILPSGWVTASKDTEVLIPDCSPALGSQIPLDINSGGPTNLLCSAVSTSNNVPANLSMFISVVDSQPPTITPGSGQENDILADANVLNGAIINYSVPTATDVVDLGVSVGCLPASGSTFPLGAIGTEVVCTATDESGNTSDPQIFSVIVQDITPPGPLVDVPLSVTLDATSSAGRTFSWGTVTATDIADGTLTADCQSTGGLTSGSTFPLGAAGTEVICRATDRAGLTSTASFVVTIEDQTPPAALVNVPASVTLEASSPNGAPFSWGPVTATDIVNGTIIAECTSAGGLTSGSTFPIGAAGTEVICTATDGALLTSTDSFTVTVLDRSPPALPVYSDLTVQATSTSGTPVTWSEVATDVVDVSVPVICLPASGSTFPIGLTAVSCSATDAALNTISDSFDVIVEDTTDPVIADIDPPNGFNPDAPYPFELAADANTITVIWPISVTDADPGLSITCEIGGSTLLPDGDLVLDANQISAMFTYEFPVGLTTVSCTATDSGGLSFTAEFPVNVLDVTAPDAPGIPLQDFSSVEAEGPSGTVVTWPPLFAADAVDVSVEAVCTTPSGSLFMFGTTTVSCTATDAAGNESMASTFDVVIVDTTAPTLSGISTSTIVVPAGASGTASPDIYNGITASDVADPAPSLMCGPNPPLPFGVNTITCTATDASGNVASGAYVIDVIDNIGPVITLTGPSSITLEAGVDTYSEQGATAIDNVDGDVTANIIVSGTVDTSTVNTYTIRYDVTDDQGQKAVTVERTVNVVDTIAPVITVPANPVVIDSEQAPVDVDYATLVTVDDAGYPNTPAECLPIPSIFDWGNTLVTCNATDAGGLGNPADTATFTITVRYLYDIDITVPKRSLRIGSTLPIDWEYRERNGGSIVDSSTFDVAISWSQTDDCATPMPGGLQGEDSGSSNFRYSASSGTWQYSLQTTALMAGDYLVVISPPGAGVSDAAVCVTLR